MINRRDFFLSLGATAGAVALGSTLTMPIWSRIDSEIAALNSTLAKIDAISTKRIDMGDGTIKTTGLQHLTLEASELLSEAKAGVSYYLERYIEELKIAKSVSENWHNLSLQDQDRFMELVDMVLVDIKENNDGDVRDLFGAADSHETARKTGHLGHLQYVSDTLSYYRGEPFGSVLDKSNYIGKYKC